MHVKNHMAMWILWFLWFLRVEYSGNQLYKPLCAFLVFVDLVWFLCGSFCGFWIDCGFWLWSARPLVLMWFLWFGGLALDAEADDCASFCSLWFGGLALDADDCASSCSLWFGGLALDADDCASSCSLWTAKKICPSPHFVLCSVSSSLEATFTNGENDHG